MIQDLMVATSAGATALNHAEVVSFPKEEASKTDNLSGQEFDKLYVEVVLNADEPFCDSVKENG